MLNIVNKSPFERKNLENCLRTAPKGDTILLIEDAVYAAMQNQKFADVMAQAAKDYKVCVLGLDLTARGMDTGNVIDGISVVDYGGFVDLATEQSAVQSWL